MPVLPWDLKLFMRLLLGLLACALILPAADLPELARVDTANFLPVIRTQIDRADAEPGRVPATQKPPAAWP
jgi:hypothetical protein